MRRSSLHTAPRIGGASKAMPSCAIEQRLKPSTAIDWPLPERTESPVAARSPGLTQHEPDQPANQAARRSGKAQSALPSYRSGAAAAEYGSRHKLLRASPWSTPSHWSSPRLQRGAGSARRVSGCAAPAGLPSARPNPSLKLTRYGRLCKPGLWHMVHLHSPGLHSLPPRAS